MRQAFEDVTQFHQLGGVSCGPGTPVVPEVADDAERQLLERIAGKLKSQSNVLKLCSSTAALRVRLMTEELGEIIEAILKGDVAAYADGLADLCYVTIGSAVQCSIPLPEVWEEVQRANISKFPPCVECDGTGAIDVAQALQCDVCNGNRRIALRDAGGKVMKPAGWTPPDIAAVLAAHRPDNGHG